MMMSMVPQLRLNTCLATVWVYEPRVPASLARFECDSLYDSLVTAYLARSDLAPTTMHFLPASRLLSARQASVSRVNSDEDCQLNRSSISLMSIK